MKYIRLTKEQFEALHEEFARFLATQSITADEWAKLKVEKPEVAEEELDVFSDLVWEGVLQNAEYVEKIEARHLYLFKFEASEIQLIAINVLEPDKDITTDEDFEWLMENYLEDSVELFQASKVYSEDRLSEIFGMVKMGGVISNGEWYNFFDSVISSENN